MTSSFRYRGGSSSILSGTSTSTGSSNTRGKDPELEKYDKVASEALQSIQYAYKACFFAFLGEVIITVVDDDIWSKLFGSRAGAASQSLSWVDYVDILDTFNLLIFGLGLMRVSRLYWNTLQDRDRRMADDDMMDVLWTLAIIWRISALSLAAVSLSMATSLRTHVAGKALLDDLAPSTLPAAVLSILVIGNVVTRSYCARNAAREHQDSKYGPRDNKKEELARDMGFRAYLNQALCAGAFAVMTCMELISWMLKVDFDDLAGSAIDRVFAIPEFTTPFFIAGLLFALNKKFLRAVIAATRSLGDATTEIPDFVYDNLFVAQKEFYTKVGDMLKDATIFRLLPYVAAPFLPYILEVAQFISPNLVEKVTALLG